MKLLERQKAKRKVVALATPYSGLERYLDFMRYLKALNADFTIDLVIQNKYSLANNPEPHLCIF